MGSGEPALAVDVGDEMTVEVPESVEPLTRANWLSKTRRSFSISPSRVVIAARRVSGSGSAAPQFLQKGAMGTSARQFQQVMSLSPFARPVAVDTTCHGSSGTSIHGVLTPQLRKN
jgi:hypothetical protein